MIGDFQLHLMHLHYTRQYDDEEPWARAKTVHEWIWAVLKKVYHMLIPQRCKIMLNMYLDFKKFSLNPTGRKDPDHEKKKKKDGVLLDITPL